MYSVSFLVFSPDHGSAVQSQKLGPRLLVMTGDSPGEVFLAGLEILQLLGQTGNLGFDLRHGLACNATFTLKVSQVLTFWTCLAEGQIGGLINILVSTVIETAPPGPSEAGMDRSYRPLWYTQNE